MDINQFELILGEYQKAYGDISVDVVLPSAVVGRLKPLRVDTLKGLAIFERDLIS